MKARILHGGRAWIVALASAGVSATGPAAAQTMGFDVGSSIVAGGAPAIIKPRLHAGPSAVSRYRMVFGFPSAGFVDVRATQCLANASCTVDAALGRVVVERLSVAPASLGSEVACLLEFRAGVNLGVYPLVIASTEFFDAGNQPVAGGGVDGVVSVISAGGDLPMLAYAPAPDPTCQPNAGDEVVFDDAPAPTFAAIDLTTSATTGPGTVSLSCSVGPGFTIVSGAEQVIGSAAPGVPIVLRCDQTLPLRGAMTCTETSITGSRPQSWDLACPRPLFADGMESQGS